LNIRTTVVNLVDSYGRTPLLIAAANGHKSLCEQLLEHGADTSVPATYQSTHNTSSHGASTSARVGVGYRYNALSLAATGSIRSMLEKNLVTWLNSQNISQFEKSNGFGDISDLLNTLSANSSNEKNNKLIKNKPNFKINGSGNGVGGVGGGIGLGLNEVYMSSSDDISYVNNSAALKAKGQVVLGMQVSHSELALTLTLTLTLTGLCDQVSTVYCLVCSV
jgi:ankyrin repeat protein